MNSEALESNETTAHVPPSPIHLKSILVPLDFSEASLKSLQYAVPLAKQFGAKLTLLHVLKAPVRFVNSTYLASLEHHQLTVIEKRLEDMIPSDLPVETAVRQNFVAEGILEVAREIDADLIITTTHGYSSMKHLLVRNTAENIVRQAPCPVLVLHEQEHDFIDPVSA
jgi:nucleotide-binding universal stress UspA family protein